MLKRSDLDEFYNDNSETGLSELKARLYNAQAAMEAQKRAEEFLKNKPAFNRETHEARIKGNSLFSMLTYLSDDEE